MAASGSETALCKMSRDTPEEGRQEKVGPHGVGLDSSSLVAQRRAVRVTRMKDVQTMDAPGLANEALPIRGDNAR